MNIIHISNNLDMRNKDYLMVDENDKCVCLKVDNGIIHPCGHIYTTDNKHYTCNKWYNKLNTPTKVSNMYKDMKIVSLVQIWNNFFQHITFDTLPKIPMLKQLIITDDDIYILVMNKIQKKLLIDFGGITDSKILIRKNNNTGYVTQCAYYINFINSSGKATKMGSCGYGLLQDYIKQDIDLNEYVCYISRRGNNKRCINVNQENNLIRSLYKLCNINNKKLKVFINPSNPDELKNILSNCCLFISVHGGAMGNIIWCNKDVKVVEIIPFDKLQERPCFYYLANALGLEYHNFKPEYFEFEKNNVIIDNLKLEKLIYSLL